MRVVLKSQEAPGENGRAVAEAPSSGNQLADVIKRLL